VAVTEHPVDLAADDLEAGDRIGGHGRTSRAAMDGGTAPTQEDGGGGTR
jgi:hypothetical protein